MPTILSHAVAAGAAAQWWRRQMPASFWIWTIVVAMLPDIDVVGFSFGIAYEDMFGHRGFTHSLFFAVVVGAVASWHLSLRPESDLHRAESDLHRAESDLHRPETDVHRPESDVHRPVSDSHRPVSDSHLWALFLWFTAVTASHGLLDALTNGGRGIAFFAPFSNQRYFFPWRPIQVSPIGVGFFSARAVRVLASEARWIWLPSAIIAVSARLSRRRTCAPSPKASAGPSVGPRTRCD